MKFLSMLKDVYYSIEYMYSEVQYPACPPPPLFLITSCSRCGMKWYKSYSVERGIFFQACLSHLFRSFMVLGVGLCRSLYPLCSKGSPGRVDIWRIWRPACFLYKIWQVSFAPCLGGLGCVYWGTVLDERNVSIRTEQFSFVCCGLQPSPYEPPHGFFLQQGLCLLTVVTAASSNFPSGT